MYRKQINSSTFWLDLDKQNKEFAFSHATKYTRILKSNPNCRQRMAKAKLSTSNSQFSQGYHIIPIACIVTCYK